MSHEALSEEIAGSLELIQRAAESLAKSLPRLKSALKEARDTAERLGNTERLLKELEGKAAAVTSSLASVENVLIKAINAAREAVHDPKLPLDNRLHMIELCKTTLDKLGEAGFKITIPTIGDSVDSELHLVKGRARSKLGKSEVADVISWGYQFPSGQGKLAEILVGDGSLAESEQERSEAPAKPKKKAGIAMVVEGEARKQRSKAGAKKAAAPLFDKLAEAAERNREKQT